MASGVERFIALRYLRAKRQEGFISVVAWFSLAGILLGVATLITVMAVMNGFRAELLGQIIGLKGHIEIASESREISDYNGVVQQVYQVPGVVQAAPLVDGQAMATGRGGANPVQVRGIRPADFRARPALYNSLRLGQFERFEAGEGIILGYRLANALGVTTSDSVTLLVPNGLITERGRLPKAKAFTVVGVVQVGRFEIDRTQIYMPLSLAQPFYNFEASVRAVEVMIEDAEAAPDVATVLRESLGEGYRVRDWQEVNSGFYTALLVERNATALILSLIVLVAAFNVISSQIMLVRDKARGIAILRTMGASQGAILRIFFLTGSSVGLVGTLIGTALGLGIALNIEAMGDALRAQFGGLRGMPPELAFLADLPSVLSWGDVAVVVIFSLFLSLAASIYPAWRAARLDPVEVLRYE